jgi:Acetyltransferase (GNAT) family.
MDDNSIWGGATTLGISLRKAEMNNCVQIHKMQVESFSVLLDKYKDYSTNPAAESIERIEQRMSQEFTDYYFICLSDDIIGAIRVVRLNNHVCRISPMFILPHYQGMGYAQQAILEAESLYPQAKHWELDTIKQESKLCYLYEKMGYRATGKEEKVKDDMTIIFYSK